MISIGNNNNGHVAGGDQFINEINPCKSCGLALLNKSDYEFYPFCNGCISVSRKKNKDLFLFLAMICSALLFLFYIKNPHFIDYDIKQLVYNYTGYTGVLNRLVLFIIPIVIIVFSTGLLAQLLAFIINRKRYPLHK